MAFLLQQKAIGTMAFLEEMPNMLQRIAPEIMTRALLYFKALGMLLVRQNEAQSKTGFSNDLEALFQELLSLVTYLL